MQRGSKMVGGHEARGGFQTTNWTLLDALRQDGSARELALEQLARCYWPPIYAAVRGMGRTQEDAMDITQGFFSDVVLTRHLFERASSERGRLRSLLLVALKRYLIDSHRAAKQQPNASVSIAANGQIVREERILHETSMAGLTAEEAFERRWAMMLLDEALNRCKTHLLNTGHERNWRAFETCVFVPALSGNRSPGLRAIARDLGFDSPAQVAGATQSVRKRLKLLLREVAAETADEPADQVGEYQRLLRALE